MTTESSTATALYHVSDIAVFQAVKGGVRALHDDEGLYAWGEFVDAADFNEDAFRVVEYAPTDFDNLDPYYQRETTEEVAQLAE